MLPPVLSVMLLLAQSAPATALPLADATPAAPETPPSLTVCAKTADAPIPGATVVVIAPDGKAFAGTGGSDGCVAFRGLAAGTYQVTVTAPGTQPVDAKVDVGPDGGARLDAKLALASADSQEVVVTADREQPGETRRTLTPQDVRGIPGAGNDALKSVQNMPGVARAPFGTGQLVVRGSAPDDTKVFLDGQEIPQLYHFGGLTSVFATEALSRIDFLPGGFGVRYGRAIGGVIDVETRPGRDDRMGGMFDVDLYDGAGMVEGPVGGGRYFAAARRSYVDAVLPLVGGIVSPQKDFSWTVAPRYYDYQMRYDVPTSENGTQAHVMAYGSDDAMSFLLSKPTADGLRGDYRYRTAFHRLQAPVTRPFGSGWLLSLVPAIGYQDVAADGAGVINVVAARVTGNVRAELRGKLADGATLLLGLDGQAERDDYAVTWPDGQTPDSQLIAANTYGAASAGAYAEATLALSDKLTIVPGLRVDGYLPQHTMSVDPRLAGRLELGHGSFAKAYAGFYHQPPEIWEWDAKLGNPRLTPAQAFQAGLGGGRRLDDVTDAEGELFYKWLSNLPIGVPSTPGDPNASFSYSNQGMGRVYGVEGIVRRALSERLGGWVSYTLSKSERASPYSGGWKVFYLDQTHILTAVVDYKLQRNWTLGARFRYVTGNPSTLVDDAVYDADQDRYYPVPGFRHEKRLPAFNQLDIRADKRWAWSGWTLDGYVDVQNVYDELNPEARRYDFNYQQSTYVTGLPIFPSFGVRGEF